MLNICEGTEVLLKSGESVTVTAGLSSWRGQRWTGKGVLHGREIQREFGDDDVRAVLGESRSASRGSAGDPDTNTWF